MTTRYASGFLATAFGLHLIWEFAVCGPFYVAGRFPLTLGGMLYVSLADAGLSALIYGLVAVGARDARWGLRPKPLAVVAAATLGAVLAIVIERHALAMGRWSYSELMPRLPMLDAGVLPVVQLALVTLAALWVGQRLSRGTRADEDPGRSPASTAPGHDRCRAHPPGSDEPPTRKPNTGPTRAPGD